MNKRQRTLLIAAGACAGLVLLYMIVNQLFLAPAADLDAQAAKLLTDANRLTAENAKKDMYVAKLRSYASRTLGTNDLLVDQQVEEKLRHLVQRSGLDPQNLDIKSANIVRKKDAYREINRNVMVQGKLDRIVNFLYLLKCEPQLQKLSNVSIGPSKLRPGEIDLQLRYSTLVLDTPPGVTISTGSPPATQPADLNSDDRAVYNVIVARDVFRPYIPKPETPVVAVTPTPVARTETPTPTPPKYERRVHKLKVVDLSAYFADEPSVAVTDSATDQTRRYKLGEELSGGKIVMVDYRLLPVPQNPPNPNPHGVEVFSPSRAILQFEREYWAVELGQSIDERRKLKYEDLPDELQGEQPTTQPVTSMK